MVNCSSAQLPLGDLPSKHGQESLSIAADVGWLCWRCWKTEVINSIWATFLPSFRQNLRYTALGEWFTRYHSHRASSEGESWHFQDTDLEPVRVFNVSAPSGKPQLEVASLCLTLRNEQSKRLGNEWLKNSVRKTKKMKQILFFLPKSPRHHLGEFELIWKGAEYLFAPPRIITLQKNNPSAKKTKRQTHTDFALCGGKTLLQLCLRYTTTSGQAEPWTRSSCLRLLCSTRALDAGSWV